jgi:toxin CptA
MPSERDIPAFRAELVASNRFVYLLSAGHLGALAIVVAMSPAVPWITPLVIALVLSWVWSLRRHALLRTPRAFVVVELKDETACALQRRNGDWVYGDINTSSYVLPWLIVLHISARDRKLGIRLALFPDSMARDLHRRLRVRLRWANYHAAEAVSAVAPL